jgi:hypothetical protein
MITEELIVELEKYGLSIIMRDKNYCLVDLENCEWFEDMSIYYIHKLLNSWNNYKKNV